MGWTLKFMLYIKSCISSVFEAKQRLSGNWWMCHATNFKSVSAERHSSKQHTGFISPLMMQSSSPWLLHRTTREERSLLQRKFASNTNAFLDLHFPRLIQNHSRLIWSLIQWEVAPLPLPWLKVPKQVVGFTTFISGINSRSSLTLCLALSPIIQSCEDS